MQLKSNDSEGTASINVMNTCHPGKHNHTLCQILKFKICLVQQHMLDRNKTIIQEYKKQKYQECWPTFNPSTWESESEVL